jgi:two-component system, NarL family, sensor kinase
MDAMTSVAAEAPLDATSPEVAGTPFAAMVAAMSLATLAIGLLLRFGEPEVPGPPPAPIAGPVGLVAFAVPGSFLLARGQSRRVGWFAVAIGGAVGLGWLAAEYAAYAGAPHPRGLPSPTGAHQLAQLSIAPAVSLLPALLLVLPDGRLVSRRWWAAVPVAAAAVVATVVSAISVRSSAAVEVVPGFEHLQADRAAGNVAIVLLVASLFLGVLSVVHRLLQAGGVERLQLRSIVFGAGLAGVLLAVAPAVDSAIRDVLVAAALVPVPAALAFAHVRHGLWLVDLAINRALVYGILVAAGVAVAAAAVSVLGRPLGERTGAPLLTIAVLAVLVQPAHQALQRAVNRLFYGDTRDPSDAIAALARGLEHDAAAHSSLGDAATTVARALRLPYVAIERTGGASAAVGTEPASVVRIPLRHSGETVGALAVSPRAGEAELRPGDLRLLRDLAGQIAVLVHASGLAEDLQRSRERLVTAREEERRRLRRDLHDELGPALAAIALRLNAARDVAGGGAEQLLEQCEEQLDACIRDVRRIVDDLGPSLVDELGLPGALAALGARFDRGDARVDVRAEMAARLPAAVEVAAYRIASEAVVNAFRHGRPSWVRVELQADSRDLCLRVADDGGGTPRPRAGGVGLRSMRERAEELGGSLRVAGTDAGVEVVVRLPAGGSSRG